MTATPRYFYRKADKLKSRKIIDSLFVKGKHFSSFPFKVFWLPQNKDASLQAAVGVSSKNFKKATDRNRVKRLIREAWRLQKMPLQDQLTKKNQQQSVFILYSGKEIPRYDLVFEKIGWIIQKLLKISDEAN